MTNLTNSPGWFIAVVLLLTLIPSHADPLIKPAPYARHLTVLDGLNLGEVNTVYQSKKGYIWLGTNEGLIRFDGFNAKRFSHNVDDPHSLSHNQVIGIFEDQQDNLWISTFGGGLSKYTVFNGQFNKIDLRVNPNDPPITELLYTLTPDDNNILWIGSDKGVIRFDLLSQKATPLPEPLNTLPKDNFSNIYFDSNKHLWFLSAFKGLYRYDHDKMVRFTHDSSVPNGLDNEILRDWHEDKQGNIWVSTQSSLHLLNQQDLSFERFKPSDNPKLTEIDNDIFTIHSDSNGRLWLGAANGIHYFEPKTRQFDAISGSNDLNKQFRRSRINRIITDADGSLWFATQQGVIYLPATAQRFNYLSNPAATLKVTDIAKLGSDKIALIANFKAFDINLNTLSSTLKFPEVPVPYRITKDYQDDLWIATVGHSLHHFSAKTQTTTRLLQDRFTSSKTVVRGLFDVFVDSKNQLWLLPFPDAPRSKGGVVRYYRQTGQTKQLLNEVTPSDIIQLNDNQLVLATVSKGLYWLDINTLESQSFKEKLPTTPESVNTLFKDSQGRMWIGSRGHGLAVYDPSTGSMDHYSIEDDLLSNNIVTIIEDDQHYLWLGSSVGLTRFDPHSKQVLTVEKQDGLLFSASRKRSAIKADDGTLVMGSKSGLVKFNPQDFKAATNAPRVIINDFKLFNQPVKLSTTGQPTVLEQPIEFTKQLVLSYQDYVFSFNFTATEFLRPDKIQFAYQMTGLDNKWFYTDANNRTASYTTLPAGDYEFKVKASNSNGVWSDQHTSIQITINPPWWLTWQAYLMYFVLLVTVLSLYVQKRTNKLRRQAQLLERRVSERTTALQQSRDQVSELLAQKQQLFASVSHEFRTPLTLILSPVDQMLSRYANQPISKELSLIKRSGRRLLRMVDQLLEFAKLEQDQKQTTEAVSLQQTIELITASFEPLLKSRQLTLTINAYEDVTLNLIPDSLNKILINLLSNAIKYTMEQGQINLSVKQDKENLTLTLTDSGIGIAKAEQQAIFQRFNRATRVHGESIPGAGIGLALVKELIEANQGEITLHSVLRQGSTFVVSLPIQTTDTPEATPGPSMASQDLALEIDSITALTETDQLQDTPLIDDERQKSLLIIDDNADMRNLLHSQLSGQYQCLQAANGQIGVELAKTHLPDLIVSDIMMPVMDGYELAETLKSDTLTSHIPIILLTAKGSVESRIKGLQLLVDDYLAKPFNIEELLLRISNTLTIREILRQRYAQTVENQSSTDDPSSDKSNFNELDQAFLDQVNHHLSEHFQIVDLNVKYMSDLMCISEKQLQRKLKALINQRFVEMVRNFRLNKAAELLQAGHRVSAVFGEIGFSSHSYFSVCFKAHFGQTPKAYQQSGDNQTVRQSAK